MIHDRLAAFLYWLSYWSEAAADRLWLIALQRQRNKIISQMMEYER